METAVLGPVTEPAATQDCPQRNVALPGAGAIALPPDLAGRSFGRACALAFAVHLLVAALASFAPGGSSMVEEPPVRLVFFEPPPPPPAPLGVPGGAGTTTLPVEPEVPETAPVQPKVPARTAAVKPRRLPQKAAVTKPKIEAPPTKEPVKETAVADAAPGVSAGVPGGRADGVVGGVEGGVPGGVVGGAGSGPIPAAQVAHPPQLLRRVAPVYPQQARQRQIEGLVLLEAILDQEGRVERDVKVIESVPMLDREAIAAVRQWRFRPARNQAGRPLRVILEIPIRFVLR